MPPQFDLHSYLRTQQLLINRELERAVQLAYPEQLFQSIRYSLLSNGKRLRPALCLASCEAAGGKVDVALPTACALEMLHTATLIHDDLPAMDNDDLRRGLPSNHMVFGEAIALLAGDALFSFSLEFVLHNTNVSPERLLRVTQMLLHTIGVNGAVGGQVVDMESENRDIDPATLEFIHKHKTGALLATATASGAVLAGADEDVIARLSRYGEKVGLAFQIVDDILDVTSSTETLGKTTKKDEKMRKATFPRLFGLEQSKQRAGELVEEAKWELEPFGYNALPLLAMADYICARSS